MTTILSGAVLALLVLLAGNVPWAGFGPIRGLSAWNLRAGVSMPWAVVPMAIYLWAYVGVIGGHWGGGDAATRRVNLHAYRVPMRVWTMALAAGLLGFAAIIALTGVTARLLALPAGEPIATPDGMPALTMLALLAMQSTVAGVSEESAFRGYMQTIVGQRLGVPTAILASGVWFGLLHFPNHPRDVMIMLPYYVAVSAMYGALTWAADSLLPAMLLHCVGDIAVLTRWWTTGLPEWQWTTQPRPLVWDSGIDSAFVANVAAFMVLSALTGWSMHMVRRRRLQRV